MASDRKSRCVGIHHRKASWLNGKEHERLMERVFSADHVGYGEGGVLTDVVRRNSYNVVLLDEAEEAHPARRTTTS
nr:AAA family ATPase [Ralstonia solanacearum]